jgi:hypothetical protein
MEFTPQMFGQEKFAQLNKDHFDDYVEYRVRGYHPSIAFVRIFDEVPAQLANFATEFLEHNPYYQRRFKERLEQVKLDKLWDTKMAVHELLGVARNPFAKDSARLNAMKELNIMYGITLVDEHGKTTRGKGLADFYASLEPTDPGIKDIERV